MNRLWGTVLLVSMAAAGCSREPEPLQMTSRSVRTDGRLSVVTHGQIGDQLTFVVFEAAGPTDGSYHSRVRQRVSDRRTFAELTLPDGTVVTLPSGTQLMEIAEGRYGESPQRVSLDDFEAFMGSQPSAYSIQALLQFVELRHHGK